ncbi:MAG TPA: Calx-beta domain-containing protein [Pyrinomonadaceae bacterium]|jgi:uncharacterized delta-60 repeat protein
MPRLISDRKDNRCTFCPRNKSLLLIALLSVISTSGLISTAYTAGISGSGPIPTPAAGALSFSSSTNSVNEDSTSATATLTRTGGTDNAVVAKVALTDVTTSLADHGLNQGTLDTSFNSGSGATSGSSALPQFVSAVALQPDGKIIIGGAFIFYDGTTRNRIARLNSDGTLDATFDPGTGADNHVYAITLQPDGKIIIGGIFTDYNGTARNRIARLNDDGTLDETFDPGAGANDEVQAIVVQPDGKIIIGGGFSSYDNVTNHDVARLNSNGTPDPTFSSGTGANAGVSALALTEDGDLLVGGGFTSFNGSSGRRIVRLNDNGSLDSAFSAVTGLSLAPRSIVLQPDGKLIVGGEWIGNDSELGKRRIVRLNEDGSEDTSFNNGAGANGSVEAVALQPDGKIVIGGFFNSFNETTRTRIARLNDDGTLDEVFDPGTGANSIVFELIVQPDGKIISGGLFTFYNDSSSNGIARINGDLFVNWAAGDASDKEILLPIVDDSLHESDETLTLNLTPLSGGATNGAFDTQTLTIVDNDNTAPVADSQAVNTNEDTARLITLAGSDADNDSLVYSVVTGPTHGALSGTEPNLTYTPAANYNGPDSFTFKANDGRIDSATVTVSITVSAVADTPSVTNAATSENTQTTSGLVISRNASDGAEVTHFKITSITNGTLFQNNGTTQINNNQFITFAQGNAGLRFTPLAGLSSPLKSFSFNVQSATGATDAGLGGASIIAPVTVNEGGVLKLSATTYSVSEGAQAATITVTRTGGSAGAASVKYNTLNGTAAGASSCFAGTDYRTMAGTLSWASGDASPKSFTVPLCNDAVYEGSETVNLSLGNAAGSASLGSPSTAVLTIPDNETRPTLSINNVAVTEANTGTTNAIFTIKLSVASSQTVTVKYATANGTALAPGDYTAVPLTTLTFTPGQLSKTVTVAVKGDALDEPNETFRVSLSAPTNATLAAGQGIGTINDNDSPPSLSINNVTVVETNTGVTFTVTLSAASGQTVSVKYATMNDTAAAPADYTAITGTLVFSPGQVSKQIVVPIKGDTLDELDETFKLMLSSPTNAVIATGLGTGTATIKDND